jgi:sialate O-acetylesterase
MASAIDIGEALYIHPKNKRDVGLRLAQWALAKTYNRSLVPNGPHYAGYSIEGNRIRIRFTDVGSGLVIRGAHAKIKTCYIADDSRKFVPAEATLDGDTLLVTAADVKAPKAVRYAWADNPGGCNLYNADGLPASPFRTDVW